MTNDDDALSPDVRAALRDVGSVDEALREEHLARALAELPAMGTTGRRWSLMTTAAAAVVALSVGALIGRSTSDTGTEVRNVATTTTIARAKASVDCAGQFGAEIFIGEWSDGETRKFITADETNFYVRDAATCAVLEQFPRR
ncbi:MAG: hypothetical protein ACO3RB_04450 [Ilumatobacteraceae bacterium]|jgi:hypothetical protein